MQRVGTRIAERQRESARRRREEKAHLGLLPRGYGILLRHGFLEIEIRTPAAIGKVSESSQD